MTEPAHHPDAVLDPPDDDTGPEPIGSILRRVLLLRGFSEAAGAVDLSQEGPR
ncbi:MAG: hypothetical protein U0836_26995 [Pirellulales bacterium]